MPGGRPPKPIEIKRRTGRSPGRDAGGRKLPDPNAVIALPGAPSVPPVPIGLKEHGRAAWTRLWTAGQQWLSVSTDVDVLTRLCQAHDERAHLVDVLDEDGHFVKGQRGGLVAHPAVTMLRMVNAEIVKLEGLCGFTPSDRSRLGYAEVKHASKLEELLARRTSRSRP